jgi:hypothetical protein
MNKVQTFLADSALELEQQVNIWLAKQECMRVTSTSTAWVPGGIIHVVHYHEFEPIPSEELEARFSKAAVA